MMAIQFSSKKVIERALNLGLLLCLLIGLVIVVPVQAAPSFSSASTVVLDGKVAAALPNGVNPPASQTIKGVSTQKVTGNGSWQAIPAATAGSLKVELIVSPSDPQYSSILSGIKVGDLASISYSTKRTNLGLNYDFYPVVYTVNPTGQVGTCDKSWYCHRLNGNYKFVNDTNWNQKVFGFTTSADFFEFQSPHDGPINPATYADQNVLDIRFDVDSGAVGFDGYLDDIKITLTNGNSLTIDLEDTAPAGPSPDLFCTGETGYVDVKLAGVTDLYGYQFQVNYDETKVSATAAFDNSFFSTVGAAVPGGWKAVCAGGTCKFAASKVSVTGAAVSGSGTIARISFVGLNPGVVTPTIADPKLSSINGGSIPGTLSLDTSSVTVCGWASASGTVNLQGRTELISAGKVKLTDGAFGPYETAFSATDGTWSINNIRVLPTGTPYTFDASHGLYLGNQKVVTLTHGMTDVSTTKLLGGDADNSGKVGINDLTCIGGDFGGTPNVCGTTGSSDINEDGVTNIFDLTLAGGNFDLSTPRGW